LGRRGRSNVRDGVGARPRIIGTKRLYTNGQFGTDGAAADLGEAEANLHAGRLSNRDDGKRRVERVNELIIPNYKQTWANPRKIADAPEVTRSLSFKSQEYLSG
jgi:hypothetical protein